MSNYQEAVPVQAGARPRYYVPDGDGGFRAALMLEWAAWFESRDPHHPFTSGGSRVGFHSTDGADVSTVFLGLDHQFVLDDGPPLVFETMIFGGPHDSYQDRYSTLAEAEAGHLVAVQIAKGEVAP